MRSALLMRAFPSLCLLYCNVPGTVHVRYSYHVQYLCFETTQFSTVNTNTRSIVSGWRFVDITPAETRNNKEPGTRNLPTAYELWFLLLYFILVQYCTRTALAHHSFIHSSRALFDPATWNSTASFHSISISMGNSERGSVVVGLHTPQVQRE